MIKLGKPYKLYCGNVIDVLKSIESESVDCVITSPPYWGQRDYGIDANVVWGGKEKCEHEWVEDNNLPTKLHRNGNTDQKNTKVNLSKPKLGKTCLHCGAWYGQLGMEPSPQMFVDHLIMIFRELKRVLKTSGNLFVVIDDTYAGSGSWKSGGGVSHGSQNVWDREWVEEVSISEPPTASFKGAPRKSLCLVPEMFAIRMVYDLNFVLRNKIIWAKKVYFPKTSESFGNAMPESVKDRLTHVWEFVYHFTKIPKGYYYNLDALRIPWKVESINKLERVRRLMDRTGLPVTPKNKYYQYLLNGEIRECGIAGILTTQFKSKYVINDTTASPGGRLARLIAENRVDMTLVRKLITDVNAYLKKKLKEANISINELSEITGIRKTTLEHYFRTDLSGAAIPDKHIWEILRPILNLDPYEERIKEEYKSIIPSPHPNGANPGDVLQINTEPFHGAHFAVFPTKLVELLIAAGCPENGVVMDPFMGSGTTGEVALKMGRKFVGIEIVQQYFEMAKNRLDGITAQRKLVEIIDI